VGWLGAVLGDGYSEVARHLHLGQNFALLGWMVLLGDWIAVIGSRRPEANPQPWSNLWPGVAAVIVTGAAVLIIRTLPLGFGVIEVPAGDRVMEGGLRLAGRALDAEGIDRIEAVTANGARTELTLSDSPAIALIFPVAAASAGHEFRGELAIEDLSARAPLRLDVVVTNSAGVQTVIDQRWLRPAPTPIPSP
jgi:hypothetical protein